MAANLAIASTTFIGLGFLVAFLMSSVSVLAGLTASDTTSASGGSGGVTESTEYKSVTTSTDERHQTHPRRRARSHPTRYNSPIARTLAPVAPYLNLSDYTAGQSPTKTQATRHFIVTVWADYKGTPRIPKRNAIYSSSHYIPTGNTYFFDLTISIRKLGGSSQDRLKEIGITIPTDGLYDVTPNSKLESLLTKSYDGPGAYMLSNQRFVPYINFTRDFLQLRLVPRSASSAPFIVLDDDKTKELSVRLAEANISEYHSRLESAIVVQDDGSGKQSSAKRTVAVVNTYERYADPGGGMDLMARDKVNVVKFNGGDDGH